MPSPLPILREKLAKAHAQLRFLPRALALVWAAARPWTIAWSALLLLQGLLPVAIVYLTRAVVDSLVAAVRAQGAWPSLRPALILALLMAAVLLAAELLRSAAAYIRAAQADLVQDHISSLIHAKSIAADLAFYDSAEFYDHLHRARGEASYRPVALLESLGSLLQNAITLLAMAAVLIPYGPWLPVLLAAGTAPALLVVLRHSLLQHEWRRQVTTDERRAWYYDWLLTAGETASELRLFGLGQHFQSAYLSLRRNLRTQRLALASRQVWAETAAGLLGLAATAVAMVWMVWRAVRGLATLGDLALFYQAFQQGLRLMRSLLENVGQLYSNILFLGNLFEFLELQQRVTDPPRPAPPPDAPAPEIHFQDVTFCYPGSQRPALVNFELTIPAGSIVAVVGSNGAGKSTLIKLLCRFYDPEAGRVRIDGVDLRQFSTAELRRSITVLFQQPVHYNATVRENIGFGDLNATEIERAATDAGADAVVERLPQGYDSLLGRWFADGVELSVGEWQRIGLARAFLRRAPILVLDEPTSAMDPWAEADWLRRFRRLAQGRTALIVTHRFTTAMHADVIHVMAEGRIVESGAHQDLLARQGRYAQAWRWATK
ncbi:MAG: ABC transporter ATP-binding protein [Bryobacterales bacterium]|nr:ABC transporter ATP-binding protein [Bryobacterales bacterium]